MCWGSLWIIYFTNLARIRFRNLWFEAWVGWSNGPKRIRFFYERLWFILFLHFIIEPCRLFNINNLSKIIIFRRHFFAYFFVRQNISIYIFSLFKNLLWETFLRAIINFDYVTRRYQTFLSILSHNYLPFSCKIANLPVLIWHTWSKWGLITFRNINITQTFG